MKIRIKNLRVRTIIGINEWEREQKQEIIINIEITFDGSKAVETDDIENTVNYKRIKRRVLEAAESANFFLLEKLSYPANSDGRQKNLQSRGRDRQTTCAAFCRFCLGDS